MGRRGLATTIGMVGGLFVLFGGLADAVLRLADHPSALSSGTALGAIVPLVISAALGLAILLASRPRLFWWPGRRLFNGILLIVLGVVTWLLVGGFVVTLIGAVLAIIAGILLPIEGRFLGAFRGRRIFHRRIW